MSYAFSMNDVEARKVVNVYSSVTNPSLQNIRFDSVPFVPDAVIVRSINYSVTAATDTLDTYFIVTNLIDGDGILGSFIVDGATAAALSLAPNNPQTVFTLRKPVAGTSFAFQVMQNSAAGSCSH